MRAINVLLSILVTLGIGVLVFEGGLRLIGKGPVKTILTHDPDTGWSMRPDARITRRTSEFVSRVETNSEGLRDDPFDLSAPKPEGQFRVLALGDSFTMGWAVQRGENFVDLLEEYWRSEGRDVKVFNVGCEAWDNAQAVRWLEVHGARYQPDLVLLFAYDNDLYWNSQDHYQTADGPRAKPLYGPDGSLQTGALPEPPPKAWHQGWAVTRWLGKADEAGRARHAFRPPGAQRDVPREFAPLLVDPPDFMAAVEDHTRGTLIALARASESQGAVAMVVPIPGASRFQENWRVALRDHILRGVPPTAWSPDQPFDTFLRLSEEVGLETFDARVALEAEAADAELYNRIDWHFNVAGNRAFAQAVHDGLEGRVALPARTAEGALPPVHTAGVGVPFWVKLYGGLLTLLTLLFWSAYPSEPKFSALVKIAVLLGVVFSLFLGIGALRNVLPPAVALYLVPAFVVLVLGFVTYKLGYRIATIVELVTAFIRRGHWYLMPLVVVLLTIGSLLVVAASSPFVAPFIYTLF